MATKSVYFNLMILMAVLLPQTIPSAFASEASKTAKLDALLENIGVYDVGLTEAQGFSKVLVQTDRRVTHKDANQTAKRISDRISRDDIKKQVLPIWEKNFTEKDIDAITAFFNSPAGKKFISVRRDIGKESATAVQGIAKQEFKRETGLEPKSPPGLK